MEGKKKAGYIEIHTLGHQHKETRTDIVRGKVRAVGV